MDPPSAQTTGLAPTAGAAGPDSTQPPSETDLKCTRALVAAEVTLTQFEGLLDSIALKSKPKSLLAMMVAAGRVIVLHASAAIESLRNVLPDPQCTFAKLLNRTLTDLHSATDLAFSVKPFAQLLHVRIYLDPVQNAQQTLSRLFSAVQHPPSSVVAEGLLSSAVLDESISDVLAQHFNHLCQFKGQELRSTLDLSPQDIPEALGALQQRTSQPISQIFLSERVATAFCACLQHACGELAAMGPAAAGSEDPIKDLGHLAVSGYDFQLHDCAPLGRGGFGEVKVATWVDNGTRVAIKRLLPLQGLAAGVGGDEKVVAVAKEARLWSQLHHPHVLPLLGVCLTADTPFFVMPFMAGGDLVTFSKGKPAKEHLRLLQETAQGMAYLHSRNVFHGDLKGKNVLIDAQSGHARVCDFGQSRLSSATSAVRALATPAAPIVGNVRWIAPERYDPRAKWSLEPDLFAFAMVVYEVVAGMYPFQDDDRATDDVLPMWIMGGHRPKAPVGSASFSEDLWALVEECWDSDWKHRPSFLQVVRELSRLRDINQDGNSHAQVETRRITQVDEETVKRFNKSLHFREPSESPEFGPTPAPAPGPQALPAAAAKAPTTPAPPAQETEPATQTTVAAFPTKAPAAFSFGQPTTAPPTSLSTVAQPPTATSPPAFRFAAAPSKQPQWPASITQPPAMPATALNQPFGIPANAAPPSSSALASAQQAPYFNFGSSPPAPPSAQGYFASSTSAFTVAGAPNAQPLPFSTPAYKPVAGSGSDPFVFASIVGMPEYSNFSVEEVRIRDYAAGRKGSGKAWKQPVWAGTNAFSGQASVTPSSSQFQGPSAIMFPDAITAARFAPGPARILQEIVETQGTATLPYQCAVEEESDGRVMYSSIVRMGCYSHFSVEELRIIDYRAGRTHRSAVRGTPFALPPSSAIRFPTGSSASIQGGGFGPASTSGTVWGGLGAIPSTSSTGAAPTATAAGNSSASPATATVATGGNASAALPWGGSTSRSVFPPVPAPAQDQTGVFATLPVIATSPSTTFGLPAASLLAQPFGSMSVSQASAMSYSGTQWPIVSPIATTGGVDPFKELSLPPDSEAMDRNVWSVRHNLANGSLRQVSSNGAPATQFALKVLERALSQPGSSLATLILSHDFAHQRFPIASAVVSTLAQCLQLATSLSALDLSHTHLSDKDLAVLAPCLPASLTSLKLANNKVGPQGALSLAQRLPHMTSLSHLALNNNQLDAPGVEAIAAELPPSITELGLESTGIVAEAIKPLAQGLAGTQIKTLRLKSNPLSSFSNSDAAISNAPAFPSTLASIDLSFCQFYQFTISALTSVLGILPPSLVSLDLTAAGLHKDHESLLVANLKRLKNLKALVLDGNMLSPAVVMSVMGACPASLETLSLVGTWAFLTPLPSAADVTALTEYLPRGLKRLSLGQNKLDDAHVVAMRSDWPEALETLNLSLNAIGDDGAEFVARFVPATLEALNFSSNQITKDGAGVVAEIMAGKSKACKVNLMSNLVMEQQRQVLKSKYPGVEF